MSNCLRAALMNKSKWTAINTGFMLSSLLYFNPRQLDIKGSCSSAQRQKRLTEWILETLCKALPSTDKLKNNSDSYLPLCPHQRRASISVKCASIVPCVGAGAPLWSVPSRKANKVSMDHKCILRCKAALHIQGRDEEPVLFDLSLLRMKYAFFR